MEAVVTLMGELEGIWSLYDTWNNSLECSIVIFTDKNKHKKTDDKISSAFLYDPYGTRTRVTSVKGRCLNHLTKGP